MLMNSRMMATLALAAGVALTGCKRSGSHEEPAQKTAEPPPAADNTGVNKRDREANSPTADQAGQSQTDVDLAAHIRRSIVDDDKLSMNAHNVKIIVKDGTVTLKGPVKSAEEKQAIQQKAAAQVAPDKVVNELEIAP
jgi:osmotically-inducible protein OsmY